MQHEGPPVLSIENYVCTAHICRWDPVTRTASPLSLDLPKVAAREYGEYNPHRFAAVIARFSLTVPESHDLQACTILQFEPGRIVVTGCKSEAAASLAAHRAKGIIADIVGVHVNYLALINLQVQNVVASASIGKKVALDDVATAEYITSLYNPSKFPGVRIKLWLNGRTMAMLLFDSGSTVYTGAHSVYEALAIHILGLSLIEPFVHRE